MYPEIIYFIRHGEALSNVTKEFSHKLVDLSLTTKGEIQSQQVGEALVDEEIEFIFSSPLKRARETAEIIAEQLDVKIHVIEEFREINVGDLEKEPPSKVTWTKHDEVLAKWKTGEDESFPGGETLTELLTRIHLGFSEIKEYSDKKQLSKVALVSHGGILYQLIDHYLTSVIELDESNLIDNCSISKLETAFQEYRMDLHLKSFNNTDHLSGVAANLISGIPDYDGEN